MLTKTGKHQKRTDISSEENAEMVIGTYEG